MTTLRRALGNSVIMIGSQAITWTATLILTGVLGHRLGDEGFGHLYLAISFCAIFGVLVEFGLNQQLVRAVARDRDLAGVYLINTILIRLAFAAIAYLLILVTTHLLGYPPEVTRLIAAYSLILVVGGISNALTGVYQASEHVLHPALATVLEKVFVAVAAIVMLSRGHGALSVAALMVTGAALSCLWQAIFLRRVVRLHGRPALGMMRGLVAGAIPFFLYWALGSVYFRVDIVMLSKMASGPAVGWYSAAYKLFDTVVFLPGMVSSVIMFPILSRLSVSSRDALRHATEKGLSVLLLLGVPVCTGLFVLAGPIVRFIYRNPEFEPASWALRWLAVALFFLYVNSLLGVALVSLNREKMMTLAALLATVFNVSFNWALIPHFQHLGAAAVTAATELWLTAYLLVIIPKDLLSRGSVVTLLKAAGAAAIMVVVLYALRGQSVLLLVPLGGGAYVASALLLRVLPAEDLELLRQAIARRRREPVAAGEGAQG